MTKKRVIYLATCLAALGISYILCRYVFFDWHGMKQFPDLLAAVSLAILLFAWVLKKQIAMLASIFGYIAGFAAGTIFQTDGIDPGGAKTNNWWIIWAAVFIACVLIGFAAEFFPKRRA